MMRDQSKSILNVGSIDFFGLLSLFISSPFGYFENRVPVFKKPVIVIVVSIYFYFCKERSKTYRCSDRLAVAENQS